ncbi:helix-turn-helix transcriptional regulator [Pelotomaculum terephthalicicum JT]|uniref:helix-turn-helix domain-containing protein n=1 Tax=Pelotomaculum terephthalicicum TaxID=206393 RepID=UPI001F04AB36|nr:helix-turn-helix transcriptional regulator [Pelotomaculum terephthalicicum]MCG9967446.1 helix-turn-helix transcriptional regulator [Pelotomaculum terephthalicicum JT]
MDVPARIIELRKQKGHSTNKLAKLAGIGQSTLREIEIGQKQPTIYTIEKICSALGIELYEFFAAESQDLLQLPPEIWKLVVDKNNYDLLKQIQAMKNKGYSNEVIIEWLTSLENTLENIKTSGVFWGGEDLEESQKYTKQEKQEIIEGLNKKLNDPNFKPPWKKNNVE